jgi:hypothetical protein
MSSSAEITTYYAYNPSHVLPAVFAALVGISLIIHTWQNLLVILSTNFAKITVAKIPLQPPPLLEGHVFHVLWRHCLYRGMDNADCFIL